jgi:hypothetical protein
MRLLYSCIYYLTTRTNKSCPSADCEQPQLFDLASDLAEAHDVSTKYPLIFAAIQANFSTWYATQAN